MILADTSVWIDHLRSNDPVLADMLNKGDVAIHPFVLGEIALATLADRRLLRWLAKLPMAAVARTNEVAQFIEIERLYGLGIGYIDVHLLASVRLMHNARLWTRDRRLNAVSERLGIAAHVTH